MIRRFGPARLVLAFSTALVLVILGIFALLCWQGFGQTVNQAKTKAQAAADVIAEETQWLAGSGALVLKQVQVALGGDPSLFSGVLKTELDGAVKKLPSIITLAVYDAAGKVVGDAVDAPADISLLSFFQPLAEGQEWRVSPQRDEAAPPYFSIEQRLSKNGTFTGVAVLWIRSSVLADFWTPLGLGPNATVSIVRDDGWVIARFPALERPLNIQSLDTFADIIAGTTGTYLSGKSVADGVSRIVAYHHLPELGLIAFAGISQDVTFAGLWTSIIIVSLLLLPIAIALMLGSIWTARILANNERTQLHLQEALAQNQVLFREIHHRVKNNLQSVTSLMRLQPIAPAIKEEMSRRIDAMSAVHEHIYRSDKFDDVEVGGYLHTLIEGLKRSYNSDVDVSEELAYVTVDKDAAMPLGLIVNEIVSNAFKHAFPAGRQGTITVRLEQIEPLLARLTVADNGIGFDPAEPGKGMGRRLIVGLTEQLRGHYEFFNDGGARFELSFPTVVPKV